MPSTENHAEYARSKKKRKKLAVAVCHTYHRISHKAHVCPQYQSSSQLGLLEHRSSTQSLRVVPIKDHGRLNHVTTEKAMESPEVVLGKIGVDEALAIVLFDSGATYSYVTSKFMQQQHLPAE